MDKFALGVIIIGALNWLLIGLFKFDLVAGIFGGSTSLLTRIIYVLVGVAGIWCISLMAKLFKVTEEHD